MVSSGSQSATSGISSGLAMPTFRVFSGSATTATGRSPFASTSVPARPRRKRSRSRAVLIEFSVRTTSGSAFRSATSAARTS